MYNKSLCCKHVAALIKYVNNESSFTKTSYEQEWGKPTVHQFAQEKYSKGKYFNEMYRSEKVCLEGLDELFSSNAQELIQDVMELKSNSALKVVISESNKDQHWFEINNLMNWMLNEVNNISLIEDCSECVNKL